MTIENNTPVENASPQFIAEEHFNKAPSKLSSAITSIAFTILKAPLTLPLTMLAYSLLLAGIVTLAAIDLKKKAAQEIQGTIQKVITIAGLVLLGTVVIPPQMAIAGVAGAAIALARETLYIAAKIKAPWDLRKLAKKSKDEQGIRTSYSQQVHILAEGTLARWSPFLETLSIENGFGTKKDSSEKAIRAANNLRNQYNRTDLIDDLFQTGTRDPNDSEFVRL